MDLTRDDAEPEVAVAAIRLQELRLDFVSRFQALRPRLMALCGAVAGGDDAPDLVQETYLRAQDRLSQLRDPALFDAWVVRIALNESKSLLRRQRLAAQRLGALRTQPSQPRDAGLIELVHGLNPDQRAVIVLHYGYGYRMREIARLLGLSEVNARTLAFRARRRLRGQLEEIDR